MAQTELSKPDVLVIEPEALSSQYVVQALQRLDIRLKVCEAMPQVVEVVRGKTIHLVILGLDMDPNANFRQLQQVRLLCPGAVVMGICPRMAVVERIALLNAGLDFVIEKPFFAEECLSAVQAILRRLDI